MAKTVCSYIDLIMFINTDKKASYNKALPNWFVTSLLTTAQESLRKTAFEEQIKTIGEKTKVRIYSYKVSC